MGIAAVEIVQGEDGRWRWHAAQVADRPGPFAARVSFRTREEAQSDVALHAEAKCDHTGRLVMQKDYLRRLISALALPCDSCSDVYFGGVYWHRRDAQGANWGVATMNGEGDHEGCTACVHEAKEELRRLYAIADEA